MGILYGYHFLYVVNNAAVEEQRQMKGGVIVTIILFVSIFYPNQVAI